MTKLRKLIDLGIHSIKYIAKHSYRSTDTIIKYAAGAMQPTAIPSQAIADLFGVSHKWLWCDDKNDIDDFEREKTYVKKDTFERMK